jgi:LPXTG-motif cell wall-anchored protein
MEVETLAGNVEKSFSTASGKVEDDCLVSYLNKVEGATLWPADGKVSAGTVLEKVIPSASGYRFVDWYSDESLTTPFDFTKAIFTDTKIYAKWVKTWDVTITTDHGTVPGSDQQIVTRTVDDGSKVAALNDLSWIGYKWGGWYSGESKYDFNKDIHADTIIYAYWIPDFKITDGNGGTAHYGSTYAFTLNYYYPDWNKNNKSGIPLDVSVAQRGGSYRTLTYGEQYVISQDNNNRVVVTLRAPYIRTLSDGATYDIIFDTNIDLESTTGYFAVSKSPKTGDESNTGLWIAVACVSALAVVAIVYALLRKRKKSKLPPTPPENLPAEKKNKNPKE